MKNRFEINTNPILSGIIDQIKATLRCPKFREYNNIIEKYRV
ncbi:hypothetical protein [Aquiflexum lacus]|nr:hypothetical protein [Aquiflexum lacus]